MTVEEALALGVAVRAAIMVIKDKPAETPGQHAFDAGLITAANIAEGTILRWSVNRSGAQLVDQPPADSAE